jgi:hypothetical protein
LNRPPAARGISLPRILLILVAALTVVLGFVIELLGWGVFGSAGSPFPDETRDQLAGVGLIISGLVVLGLAGQAHRSFRLRSPFVTRLGDWLLEWNRNDDATPLRGRAINLALVSFLSLFLELALIRWLGVEIKVFAYLKNIVLIAAFLGLGLGFLLSRRRYGLLPLLLPLVFVITATSLVGERLGFWIKTILPNGDQIVLLGLSTSQLQTVPLVLQLISWLPYYGITIVYFLLVVITFIPLGQYTGKCMNSFAPIPGYSMNLGGALAGTLLFAVLSFTWLPPVIWFAIATLVTWVLLRASPALLWRPNIASGVALIAILALPDGSVWSPYQKLVLTPLVAMDAANHESLWGYQLSIGEYYYQDLTNLSPSFLRAHPGLPAIYQHSEYEVPYKFVQPNNVLVLGAGTGNDVAAALRAGAKRVDAVDIDPAILRFGVQFHPEQPYASPAVTLIANDARAYVHTSKKTYDLVLFGLLDSQQVLSAFGSVRLDNYVYTTEGVRDAFARVRPDGMLALTFQIFQPWIADRIGGIIQAATGQKPVVIDAHHGTVFLVRRGTPLAQSDVTAALDQLSHDARVETLDSGSVPLTTDDWPYLYLRDHQIPLAYLSILPLLGLLSVGVARRVLGRGWQIEWRFFFLGAGFMLMEVRIIAQVALLFGATWLVSAAAISVVLLMAIIANLVVASRRSSNVALWGVFLLASLLVSSFLPLNDFLSWGQGFGAIAALLVLATPVLFSGMLFSTLFRQTTHVEIALASNLLGSILGGLIEYLSLVWGISSLGWLAALIYVIALLTAAGKAEKN